MTASPLQIAYTGCPLCGAESVSIGKADCTRHSHWHKPLPTELEWLRCGQCSHVYTRHYYSKAGLEEVFRNTHAYQQAGITDNPDAKRAVWVSVVERAISLLAEKGYRQVFADDGNPPIWVDIGCGDGALVMTAEDFGFMSIGLDARAETVAKIQQLGFNARQADFMQINFDRQPDVLSMMDVLEHMPYPREALLRAAGMLRPGGVIVISLPDLNCSSWRIMDAAAANPYWMEIEHHHNFSRQRLIGLLRECGFEPAGLAIPHRYKAQMELYAVRTP